MAYKVALSMRDSLGMKRECQYRVSLEDVAVRDGQDHTLFQRMVLHHMWGAQIARSHGLYLDLIVQSEDGNQFGRDEQKKEWKFGFASTC